MERISEDLACSVCVSVSLCLTNSSVDLLDRIGEKISFSGKDEHEKRKSLEKCKYSRSQVERMIITGIIMKPF